MWMPARQVLLRVMCCSSHVAATAWSAHIHVDVVKQDVVSLRRKDRFPLQHAALEEASASVRVPAAGHWPEVEGRRRTLRLDIEIMQPLCGSLYVIRTVLVSRHHIPEVSRAVIGTGAPQGIRTASALLRSCAAEGQTRTAATLSS